MKKIYTTWGFEKDNQPHTLVEGEGPLRFANGEVDCECEKLFWTIEACSYEKAMSIYYLRQGWYPYKHEGEAEPCPKCGGLLYPKSSGQCWRCDYRC
jgi:hypothetical protein